MSFYSKLKIVKITLFSHKRFADQKADLLLYCAVKCNKINRILCAFTANEVGR